METKKRKVREKRDGRRERANSDAKSVKSVYAKKMWGGGREHERNSTERNNKKKSRIVFFSFFFPPSPSRTQNAHTHCIDFYEK